MMRVVPSLLRIVPLLIASLLATSRAYSGDIPYDLNFHVSFITEWEPRKGTLMAVGTWSIPPM